jgi:hypothetical protein
MKKLLLATALVAASLTAGAASAQEKQDLTPAQQAESRLILETARNLVSYGEARGDALALVTAAKMMASVPGRVLADGQTGEAGADNSAAFDIEGVLKKAEDLAQGDELITRVAGQVREAAAANSKAVCYWQYYCYYNGWCEYAYACW